MFATLRTEVPWRKVDRVTVGKAGSETCAEKTLPKTGEYVSKEDDWMNGFSRKGCHCFYDRFIIFLYHFSISRTIQSSQSHHLNGLSGVD